MEKNSFGISTVILVVAYWQMVKCGPTGLQFMVNRVRDKVRVSGRVSDGVILGLAHF